MKHLLLAILMSTSLFIANISHASYDEEQTTKILEQVKEGDYEGALETANSYFEYATKKKVSLGLLLANVLINGSDLVLSKHGYYLRYRSYYVYFALTKKEEFLVMAGGSLLNSTRGELRPDDGTLDRTMSALFELGEEHRASSIEFVKLARIEKEAQLTDVNLKSAFLHIRGDRWVFIKSYLDSNLFTVNDQYRDDGTSLLHMAIWYGKTDFAKELVMDYGADINLKDNDGDGALKYAQHIKDYEMIRFLQARGAK